MWQTPILNLNALIIRKQQKFIMKKLLIIFIILLSGAVQSQNNITLGDTNSGYLIPNLFNTHNLFGHATYPSLAVFMRSGNNFSAQPEGTKIYGIACLLADQIPDSIEYYAFFYRDIDGCIAVDSIRVDTVEPTTYLHLGHIDGLSDLRDTLVALHEVFFDRGYSIDASRFTVAIGYLFVDHPSIRYNKECPLISINGTDTCMSFMHYINGTCLFSRVGNFFGAIPIIDSTLRIRHETMLTCGNIGKLRADYIGTRVMRLHWGDTNQHCLYQVAYGPANLPFDSYTIFETTDTNFILSGLNIGERFAFRVRSKCCFNDSLSIWKPWSDTVQFERPYYSVSVHANNNAWGHVLGNGRFEQNSLVTIEARPADSCSFCRWDDGDTSSIRQLTLVCDTSLIAIFEYHPDTSYHYTHITIANEDYNVTVTPNPTATTVRITALERILHVELYDQQGRNVLSSNATGNSIKLDLTDLPSGIYTAAVLTEQGLSSRKIIKR